MALTNYYVQSGASDVNAGSTTNNAAAVTVTNGSWDITAETFIGVTGTEFAAVNVGDWASIYIDGATLAVFISQVTAVGALGVSITVSTTQKYGTKPSASATGRSCKVGGAHATLLPWSSTGIGGTTAPFDTKINVKQATYSLGASITFSVVGTTTAIVWFSGYNTTPGDLDNDTTNALAKPVLALGSTFLMTASGAYQIWSGVSITSSRTGSGLVASGASQYYSRTRVENTSSNAGAIAMTTSGAGNVFAYSWFKAPTTATTSGVIVVSTSSAAWVGCVSEGGGLAGWNLGVLNGLFTNCIALSNTGSGISLSGAGTLRMFNCTVYGASADGVKFTTGVLAQSMIVGCVFSNCAGIAINNASGTDTANLFRANNDFYSNGTNEAGFGDAPAWFGQTDSASPFVSAPTNLTLATVTNARQNGFPGVFENETYSSFLSIGAVQPTSASSGGFVGIIS